MVFDTNFFITDQDALPLITLLDLLEIDLNYFGQGDQVRAEKFLYRMDVVNQKISSQVESQISVTAEKAQFEFIQRSLEKNGRLFLRDMGGIDKLAQLRGKVRPAVDRSWWFIEKSIERQKKKRIRSIGILIGSIAILAILLIMVFNIFLKPDPIVVARYTHEMNAEQFLANNDPNSALREINEALTLGQDANLLVLRGVVENLIGQKVESTADFANAEIIFSSRNTFLLARAGAWLQAGQPELTVLDSQEVIRNDPESAQGYFYLAKALELEQKYDMAVSAYQKASDLAERQGKAELNATIRISLALLIQSIPPESAVTRTVTP